MRRVAIGQMSDTVAALVTRVEMRAAGLLDEDVDRLRAALGR